MSISTFHFGQSLDIAWWSPWKIYKFGSFWQSSKLCPSSPYPAQTAFLYINSLYVQISGIENIFGDIEILLTAMIPCGWFFLSSTSTVSSSSHLMKKFDEFKVLCGESLTGKYPSCWVVLEVKGDYWYQLCKYINYIIHYQTHLFLVSHMRQRIGQHWFR